MAEAEGQNQSMMTMKMRKSTSTRMFSKAAPSSRNISVESTDTGAMQLQLRQVHCISRTNTSG